jgi:RsiW-degrading membrane proteinase PrsW (M82 family)
MQSANVSFVQHPTVFILALLAGIVPAILWLVFWLREDESGRREPLGLVVLTFVAGMLSVIFVLPVEKFITVLSKDQTTLITLWATSEELFKYLAFSMIMANSEYLDRPVEYAIYMIAAGLGFAALENALYLIHPVSGNDATVSVLTGNLRFLGSTLLHSVTSGIVGISIGLAFFRGQGARSLNLFFGIAAAITLHSAFNFFIMKDSGENFIQIFGFLWVVTIIIMLLFEKLRRMGSYVEQAEPITI